RKRWKLCLKTHVMAIKPLQGSHIPSETDTHTHTHTHTHTLSHTHTHTHRATHIGISHTVDLRLLNATVHRCHSISCHILHLCIKHILHSQPCFRLHKKALHISH